jgi:hypothetical protein
MFVLALEASTSAAKALLLDTKIGVAKSIRQCYDADIDDGQGRTDTDCVFRDSLCSGKRLRLVACQISISLIMNIKIPGRFAKIRI